MAFTLRTLSLAHAFTKGSETVYVLQLLGMYRDN
jgi:hypothetical protein